MSGASASGRSSRRLAHALAMFVMPALAGATQFLAERTAHVVEGQPFGVAWLIKVARSAPAQMWLGVEVVALLAWLTALGELKVSEAFPLTAVEYVVVVAIGWVLFREPVTAAQVAGGLAILVGVWLLGREPEPGQ